MAAEHAASPSRRTALAVVEAFNGMDIDAIMSYRSEDCIRHILPSTLGHPPTDNMQYRAQLEKLKPIFRNFRLDVKDMLEDKEAGRICMYLSARADTMAGEYVNEYMWTLSFDETGTRIAQVNEFVDTIMNRDFWPRLSMAIKEWQKAQAALGTSPS
ncbi:hypothetical protein LTR37_016026 [Vermiconidia calcicola]|uniref:Uncharacterized protein n=1 Tax=Vermiconidia calcicola TaxID=1690605 RepID=A0ACC3MQG8_9PEZI|nr:hypothetical protein LTR37_016026 [Vermiconidia calcicola]